jgi:hypothetical protein
MSLLDPELDSPVAINGLGAAVAVRAGVAPVVEVGVAAAGAHWASSGVSEAVVVPVEPEPGRVVRAKANSAPAPKKKMNPMIVFQSLVMVMARSGIGRDDHR